MPPKSSSNASTAGSHIRTTAQVCQRRDPSLMKSGYGLARIDRRFRHGGTREAAMAVLVHAGIGLPAFWLDDPATRVRPV